MSLRRSITDTGAGDLMVSVMNFTGQAVRV